MRVLSFILLIGIAIISIIIGVFYHEYFSRITDVVANNIWPAIIAVLTFLGFVTAGVIKSPPRSFNTFLSNQYLQIAVIMLFIFSAGILVFIIRVERLGTLHVVRKSGNDKQLRAMLISQNDSVEILVPQTLMLPRGLYKVKLTETDYVSYEGQANLKPGLQDTIVMTDVIVRPYITFTLKTGDAESQIPVEVTHTSTTNGGITKTVNTPQTVVYHEQGAYQFKLDRPGFYAWDTVILVDALSKRDYVINIPIKKRTGHLVIQTTPSGASIVLDGHLVGVTPLDSANLPFGTYSILLRKNGFADVELKTQLSYTQPHQLLRQDLVQVFHVNFVCLSSSTEYEVAGGRYKGDKTNVLIVKGEHLLTYRSPGVKERQTKIRVQSENQIITVPN